jgi:nicotinamide-nucleotide amidase
MTEELEVLIGQKLVSQKRKLAVAESCTGGLIAHLITNVAGSSAYFIGGIVPYNPAVKEKLLGVRSQTLAQPGVVSAEVALELARGVRKLLGTDIGLGVTGVAGPGGGSQDKPVGLVFIALSTESAERSERLLAKGDRTGIKMAAARAALALLNDHLAK